MSTNEDEIENKVAKTNDLYDPSRYLDAELEKSYLEYVGEEYEMEDILQQPKEDMNKMKRMNGKD